jgi:hypothetical protein
VDYFEVYPKTLASYTRHQARSSRNKYRRMMVQWKAGITGAITREKYTIAVSIDVRVSLSHLLLDTIPVESHNEPVRNLWHFSVRLDSWAIWVIWKTLFWGPSLWSSGQSFWLQIQSSRVLFPVLPHFLRNMGSGTGSTQPREDNWGATWMKK